MKLLNRIHDRLWAYQPLPAGIAGGGQGPGTVAEGRTRVKRVYDKARTPLERLEESGAVSPHCLKSLKRSRDAVNPLHLREEIYDLMEQLLELPGARPGVTENVFLTLNLPSDPRSCSSQQHYHLTGRALSRQQDYSDRL